MTLCPLQEAPKQKAKAAPQADVSRAQGSSTIFVKNLPWSADSDSLAEFFAECGPVANVRVGACASFISFALLQARSAAGHCMVGSLRLCDV
jgi:hypothetical protein